MISIPRLESRFEAMISRRFELQVAETLPDLRIVRSAALEMRTSDQVIGLRTFFK